MGAGGLVSEFMWGIVGTEPNKNYVKTFALTQPPSPCFLIDPPPSPHLSSNVMVEVAYCQIYKINYKIIYHIIAAAEHKSRPRNIDVYFFLKF